MTKRSKLFWQIPFLILLIVGTVLIIRHSKTSKEDMARYLKYADIVVVAVGRKHLVGKQFEFKPSAILVDVGINRDEEGLHGDIEPGMKVALLRLY